MSSTEETDRDLGVIRLTVPAEPDMVQVLRVAVRVVAGRAGCSDDARSRLQAAVGAAYFAILARLDTGSEVAATLRSEQSRMVVELGGGGDSAPELDLAPVVGLADGQELGDEGRALRLWVAC